MKTFVRFAFFLAVAMSTLSPGMTLAVTSGSHRTVVHKPSLAPADEYFGPLSMSILGIVNDIALLARRQAAGQVTPPQGIANMQLLEGSIREWESKYPGDPWLSRVLLSLNHAYGGFEDDAAKHHAARVGRWLLARYPASKEALKLRGELASAAQPVHTVVVGAGPAQSAAAP